MLRHKEDLASARKIHEQLESLLTQASSFASDELRYDTNDWNYQDLINDNKDKADFIELTEEAFIKDLTPSTIDILENGNYIIWYITDGLYTDHVIYVYANLSDGCLSANIEW